MSKISDIANLIRTRLLTAPTADEIETLVALPDLGEDGIIVDRQKNIRSLAAKAIDKNNGTAIVILWNEHAVKDKNAKRPRMGYGYNVAVWSKPVIAGDEWAADDVMESIINRMWHWVPGGGHSNSEVEIRPGGMVSDDNFLIYDCGLLVPASH
jgi:hypothetical protein